MQCEKHNYKIKKRVWPGSYIKLRCSGCGRKYNLRRDSFRYGILFAPSAWRMFVNGG